MIVPVVDLRLKLDYEGAESTDFANVIVLNVREQKIGAVIDPVSDVLELDPEGIRPAAAMNLPVDADFITETGCIRTGDVKRMLISTNIEALMSSADLC